MLVERSASCEVIAGSLPFNRSPKTGVALAISNLLFPETLWIANSVSRTIHRQRACWPRVSVNRSD